MIVDVLINYSSAIIAIANIILITFIFYQIRNQKKPVITTKVISREKKVGDRPDVLESGVLYLGVSNISNNQASDLKINYELNWGSGEIKVRKPLVYLNSGEATKFVLGLSRIIDEHPALFEEKVKGRITKKIPKKSLKILLNVEVSYNPLLHILFPHRIKDAYEIEWGSLESYPNFEDHPVTLCWNRRDELYIYKIGESKC